VDLDGLTARVMTRSGYRADQDRASAIVVRSFVLFVGFSTVGDQRVSGIRFVPARPPPVRLSRGGGGRRRRRPCDW
jgi:hypothetical protein